MSPQQRPYERAEKLGVENLSDAELLAIILRTGTKGKSSLDLAQEVLAIDKGKTGLLNFAAASTKDFQELPGLGRVKSLELSCIAELSKRIQKSRFERSVSLKSSREVYEYLQQEVQSLDYEVAYVLLFDDKERLIHSKLLSIGSKYETALSPREILRYALDYGASSLILAHNHPSGSISPSGADISFTKVLRDASEVLSVRLRDSIIIGESGYLSFAEKGIL